MSDDLQAQCRQAILRDLKELEMAAANNDLAGFAFVAIVRQPDGTDNMVMRVRWDTETQVGQVDRAISGATLMLHQMVASQIERYHRGVEGEEGLPN